MVLPIYVDNLEYIYIYILRTKAFQQVAIKPLDAEHIIGSSVFSDPVDVPKFKVSERVSQSASE